MKFRSHSGIFRHHYRIAGIIAASIVISAIPLEAQNFPQAGYYSQTTQSLPSSYTPAQYGYESVNTYTPSASAVVTVSPQPLSLQPGASQLSAGAYGSYAPAPVAYTQSSSSGSYAGQSVASYGTSGQAPGGATPGAGQPGPACFNSSALPAASESRVTNPDGSISNISVIYAYSPFDDTIEKRTTTRTSSPYTRQLPGKMVKYNQAAQIATFSVSCSNDDEAKWAMKTEKMARKPILGLCVWSVSDPERVVYHHRLRNDSVHEITFKLADLDVLNNKNVGNLDILKGISDIEEVDAQQLFTNNISPMNPMAVMPVSYNAPVAGYVLKEAYFMRTKYLYGGSRLDFSRTYESKDGVIKSILGDLNRITSARDLQAAGLAPADAKSCIYVNDFEGRADQYDDCTPVNLMDVQSRKVRAVNEVINAQFSGTSLGSCNSDTVLRTFFRDLGSKPGADPVG